MSSKEGPPDSETAPGQTGSSLYGHLRETILTGIAITVPVAVTLYVLAAVLDFVVTALTPIIRMLRWLGVIQRVESVELIVFLIDLGVYRLSRRMPRGLTPRRFTR